MSRDTVQGFARRLVEHSDRVRAPELAVVVHGGEPLLYPDLDFFFATLKVALSGIRLRLAIQTNATLIDEDSIDLLAKHDVHVGISLDGPREVNDVTRRTHDGTGSFNKIASGISLLRTRSPELLESVLQVINTDLDPVSAVQFLESLAIPRADFLFPDWNHDSIKMTNLRPGMLGQWLINAFDYWCERPNSVYIRIFVTISRLLLGGRSGSDHLGVESTGTVVIETDGSYEIHDGLKATFEGAGRTGMTVACD